MIDSTKSLKKIRVDEIAGSLFLTLDKRREVLLNKLHQDLESVRDVSEGENPTR